MSQEQDTAWYDQPDAMNEGTHIALCETWNGQEEAITCECGRVVMAPLWEMHCESEGE